MKKINSKELRQLWLDFFAAKGHEVVPSKSLIPVKDPSLLWINSGVATLKDEFSGKVIPKNPRIVNSQKSIRTNDIENVGVTARHHTLFEMLGNFSIGDYFKDEAIDYAYEFIFDALGFEKDKIFVTYFDEDQDALNKWKSLGIEDDHIIKGNRDTNFWDVGQGPCGPCSEIFYDRGERYDPDNVGIKLLQEDLENDRYVEIWNLVFSQFNNDGQGNYSELSQKNIDTGAGLERIASIIQDVPTNFDTDLFQIIIKHVEELTGKKYKVNNYFDNDSEQRKINKSFKVIADHLRAVVMAIQDGAKPSNTSRGYIIRRLIRRAYRSIKQLGATDETILYKLVPTVKTAFDIYEVDVDKVIAIIKKEEIAFARTIKQGEDLLMKSIEGKNELDAGVAFKLFETYGFPIELTQEILEEKGITLDMEKFAEYKTKHAEASRGKTVSGMDSQIQIIQSITEKVSEFIGYETTATTSEVIFTGEELGKYYVVTKETPFYATGGGQHYDKGTINNIEVKDVFKDKYGNHWHVLDEEISANEAILQVDKVKRLNTERNHTGTHLLGKAIADVLGQSVQLGSDNNDRRLRLDFPSDKRPTSHEVEAIEKQVNNYIKTNAKRIYHVTNKAGALAMGAIMLEDDNYGDVIRVVELEGISKEFCGGTHIDNVGKIEKFKITKIDSKGSGTFRIEAVTSTATVDEFVQTQIDKYTAELNQVIEKNKKIDKNYKVIIPSTVKEIREAIDNAKKDNKKLSKKNKDVKIDISGIEFKDIDGIKTYISTSENPGTIKPKAITLREAHPDALIILEAPAGGKKLIVVASKEHNSIDVFKSKYPEAKGGGGPDFAMGSL